MLIIRKRVELVFIHSKMPSLNQIKAVVVRAGLCLHFVLVVWRVTVSWTDSYWLLAAGILPFLVEGLYTVTKRNGIEWKL